jgi:signal transduction histidine kinase
MGTADALVRQNRNSISVTLDPHLGRMHADLTKTRQILFNLLSNAAKFTGDGRIDLRARRIETNRGTWSRATHRSRASTAARVSALLWSLASPS